MRSIRLCTVLLLLAPAAARAADATAAPAPATPGTAAARAHYEQGTRLYDLGRYDEAAAEFQRTFELSGAPELLFNIAQSEALAKHYERALLSYRSYLRRLPDAPNRPYVERRIHEMQELAARKQAARAARAPAPTPAAVAPPPATVAPTTRPAPPARAVPLVDDGPRRLRLRRAGYALGGLAAAALAAGVATTVLSQSAQSTLERDARQNSQTFTPALERLYTTGRAEGVAGAVCFAAAGAFVVSSAVTLALGLRHPEARVALAPAFGRGSAALALAGRF